MFLNMIYLFSIFCMPILFLLNYPIVSFLALCFLSIISNLAYINLLGIWTLGRQRPVKGLLKAHGSILKQWWILMDEDINVIEEFTKLLEVLEIEFGLHKEIVEIINMKTEKDEKELRIVDDLEWEDIINIFKEYMDVFASSYRDMLGLDPTIASHKIHSLPEVINKRSRSWGECILKSLWKSKTKSPNN